ncbi:hypothetical protein [Fulvimarina sp. MAC8]
MPQVQKSGEEFLVDSVTAINREEPTIAGLSNGGFVVSWQDYSKDGREI